MLTGFFQNKKSSDRLNLNEWVNAVNSDGRFGKWGWAVSFRTSDIKGIIKKHSNWRAADYPKIPS
jgi:type III restriction enzyme